MKRLLFVSTSTTLGGAEKTLFTLASRLPKEKYSAAGVVSLKPLGEYGRKLSALGMPVFSLDLDGWPSWRHLSELSRIIRHLNPDLVHAFMYQAIELTRIAKILGGNRFRLISSPRVTYRTRSPATLLLDRALKPLDNLLISESESSRGYLIYQLGYAANKVATIYNGLEGVLRPDLDFRRRKRLELGLGDEDILVGTVGRLDAQKDHKTLVQALAKVRENYPVSCVIIGEGPQRASLQARIETLGAQKYIRLLGESQAAAAWLSCLDIFSLPSLWEGLPNALLEAMAAGLPVIASAVDGICEVIKNEANGLLVIPGNPLDLADKIAQLSADFEKRRRLGQAGQNTIVEKFTLDRMLSSYSAAYDQVLS